MARARSGRLLLGLALGLALLIPLAVAPSHAHASSVDKAIAKLRKHHEISKTRARWALRTYAKAVKLNAALEPARHSKRKKKLALRSRRRPMTYQINYIAKMARRGKISRTRVTPLFSQLAQNTRWFKTNGPRPYATDRRFAGSRIIYEYFPGFGWQFHPLSNFSKLNAVWTVDTPIARRASRAYAKELLKWGVKRGHGLVWEYNFPFSGSAAPWISSISQGTAIQAFARIGYKANNQGLLRAAVRGAVSFDTPPPVGVRLRRDGGYHYLGYSGNRRLLILNMFLQSIDSLHDYSLITNNRRGRYLFRMGVNAARVETPKFDTGSWSLYSLNGEKSDRAYHELTIGFLDKICKDTKEPVFCKTRDKFQSYL